MRALPGQAVDYLRDIIAYAHAGTVLYATFWLCNEFSGRINHVSNIPFSLRLG
ncbi:hypothetical protein BDR05DRAFT_969629 [Suillus weaverae]|nr:hypothetical protein BDR05DRAFT_969629 [Suillus weaverae]